LSLALKKGPFSSREFRLLFSARAISVFGNFIAPTALAFAVLDLTGSTTDLGIVLAARSIPQIFFILVGGIWSDRFPRHLVMVVSSLIMGASQLLAAILLITHNAELWHIAASQVIWGIGFAFFFPASTGLVPQTVKRQDLQQANALLRLTLNTATVGGAAIGGVLVAATGSGWALALDALTFFVSAALLGVMRIARAERVEAPNFLNELKEGWREFASRTWLWTIVLAFTFINMAFMGMFTVLAPAVARDQLGGAAAFGLIIAAEGIGLLAGGFGGLRFKPARPLFVGALAMFLVIPVPLLLSIPAPLIVIAIAAFAMGVGLETFTIYWDTALQQHVPEAALSRVSSYDVLGSIVFVPIGQAIAGPVAATLGINTALLLTAVVMFVAIVAMIGVRDIRHLPRGEPMPADPVLISETGGRESNEDSVR
jgi:MFS family permease